jgi:hypothetical protein
MAHPNNRAHLPGPSSSVGIPRGRVSWPVLSECAPAARAALDTCRTWLGAPCVPTPCSQTPAGPVPPGQYGGLTRPTRCQHRRLPAGKSISGLNSTALARAVYASSLPLLAATEDSLPAAGPALPGGIGYPQGSTERFQGCSRLHPFSFPKLSWRSDTLAPWNQKP